VEESNPIEPIIDPSLKLKIDNIPCRDIINSLMIDMIDNNPDIVYDDIVINSLTLDLSNI
jgi:hypothetical protein